MFCCQKNFSNPTLPVDEAQFYALVTAKQWNENIDKYRETGEASLKRKLPAFIFQATFDETTSKTGKTGAWRKQSATRLTGLVVMDIDHVEDPRAVFEGWGIGDPSTTLGMTKGGARDDKSRILLVYVTPSGKGLKVVFKADASLGNLIDNPYFIWTKNFLRMRTKRLVSDILLYIETVIHRLRTRMRHHDHTPPCHLDRTE